MSDYAALLPQGSWDADGLTDGDALVNSPPAAATPTAPPPSPPPLSRIVEALLFVGGEPLTAERACAAVRGLTAQQFLELIDTLNREYRRQGRPYAIQSQGPGYILTLRAQYRPVVERLYGSHRQARLSSAAIDVLSVVAYRQPVTKQEVDTIRGAESGALLRQLVRRGLASVFRRAGPEGDVTYGTTPRFLELFHLRGLDDLPRTQDLQKI
jgi:segregation and condensation protein B